MQNAELFRRGVVVPLSDEAEQDLRSNDVSESTNVEYVEIHDQSLFEMLFQLEFFSEVNRRCNVLIDDYEEGFVENRNVPQLVTAVEIISQSDIEELQEVKNFLNAVHKAATKAVAIGRPVLIVL